MSLEGDAAGMLVADLGAAVYKHFPVRNFYVTPLVGAHFTVMQSDEFELTNGTLATLGLRAEGNATWLFGSTRRHAIKATLGLGLQLGVNEETGEAELWELDKPGMTFSLMLGYALRFTTPFGQTSLITLE
jgi:hypothetical protein